MMASTTTHQKVNNNCGQTFHIYLDVADDDDNVNLLDGFKLEGENESENGINIVTSVQSVLSVGSPTQQTQQFVSAAANKTTLKPERPHIEQPEIRRNCSKCSASFQCSGQLEQHTLQIHHVGLIKYWIQCSHCRRGFHDRATLRSHVSALHTASNQIQPTFPCKYCTWQFECQQTLQQHMTADRTKPHCNSDGSSAASSATEIRTPICDVCDFVFSSIDELATHIISKHTVAAPRISSTLQNVIDLTNKHICQVCNSQFPTLRLLRRHSRMHTGEPASKEPAVQNRVWKCHACKKKFHCEGLLAKHNFTKHQNRYKGDYWTECPHCSRIYNCKTRLASHVTRLHRDDNPMSTYRCEHCLWIYERVHTLAHHMGHNKAPIRANDKHHICDICKSRFSSIVEIYQHLRFRHGAKIRAPYNCDECSRPHEWLNKLAKHIRTHTGERPFLCQLCSRRYQSGRNLLRHMRRNHYKQMQSE